MTTAGPISKEHWYHHHPFIDRHHHPPGIVYPTPSYDSALEQQLAGRRWKKSRSRQDLASYQGIPCRLQFVLPAHPVGLDVWHSATLEDQGQILQSGSRGEIFGFRSIRQRSHKIGCASIECSCLSQSRRSRLRTNGRYGTSQGRLAEASSMGLQQEKERDDVKRMSYAVWNKVKCNI